jgi:nitrogen fixation/metabolism regulation signal transduction histidine kinase
MLGKTERRLALVILLSASLPLVVAVLLANSLFSRASLVWLNPEVGQQLDQGVSLYKDYVRAVKDDMKHQTDAIAADGALRTAAHGRNRRDLELAIDRLFPRFPELVSVAIQDADGDALARRDRGHPVDDTVERKLDVRRPLTDDAEPIVAVATFAFHRRYEAGLERAGQTRDTYANLEKQRANLFAAYLKAFGALLGMTMLVTVLLGFILARGVTKRIIRLANAFRRVTAGDLGVRVPVTGSDELTELARVFNRMLQEMQQSRARIEYLQRIGAWQEMAQRLAHEIKNPLTPIQLAVQECHRKYTGEDRKYQTLLDTTREIVEEEVGTLRRLVGNFSSFARLPQAELTEADLREFVRECSEHLGHLEDLSLSADSADAEPVETQDMEVLWEVPSGPIPVAIDRQMLRRVVVNLVRNSVQAIRDANGASKRVVVRAAAEQEGAVLVVEDSGPGVPEGMRERIFDPYFTTKADGTGLGLAIVKKIIVEHGGSIEVGVSDRLGGACVVVRLPGPRSLAVMAARDRLEAVSVRSNDAGSHG